MFFPWHWIDGLGPLFLYHTTFHLIKKFILWKNNSTHFFSMTILFHFHSIICTKMSNNFWGLLKLPLFHISRYLNHSFHQHHHGISISTQLANCTVSARSCIKNTTKHRCRSGNRPRPSPSGTRRGLALKKF